MNLFEYWILGIATLSLIMVSMVHFLRRISRAFRRTARRAIRRVSRVQRRFAKTDPKIFNAINASSKKYMESAFNKKGKNWGKEKDIKQDVKNKVAIEIERAIQESPMREMRPLVVKTIEATIDLAYLKELSKRGDQARVVMPSAIGKILWRLVFPLITAGVVGGLTYIYPDRIPPGSLTIPERQRPPTGGNYLPIDPLEIIQSTAINAAVFGVGALVLVGLIILIRRR